MNESVDNETGGNVAPVADIRIAIVIPTFNSERTIEDTLASLENQGKSLAEVDRIFLMDDHSTDNTAEVCARSWSDRLPLEIVVAEHHRGQFALKNHTLTSIHRDYDWFLILHSDDVAKPEWIRTTVDQIKLCNKTTASVCSSWDTFWDDGRSRSGEDEEDEESREIRGTVEAVSDTLRRGCWWHISGCAIRSSAFMDVGLFDVRLPQTADFDWLVRCLLRGWSIDYVPRTLIRYRQHGGTVSSVSMRSCQDLLEYLELYRRYERYAKNSSLALLRLSIAGHALRRAGRSVTKLDLVRLRAALGVLCRASIEFLSSLAGLGGQGASKS